MELLREDVDGFPGLEGSCNGIGWGDGGEYFANQVFALIVCEILVPIICWFMVHEVKGAKISNA